MEVEAVRMMNAASQDSGARGSADMAQDHTVVSVSTADADAELTPSKKPHAMYTTPEAHMPHNADCPHAFEGDPVMNLLGIHPDGLDAPVHMERSPMPSGFTLPVGFAFLCWRPLTFQLQPSSPLSMFATPYAGVPSLSQSSELPLPDILAAAADGYRQEAVGMCATPPPAQRKPPATPAKETQSLPEGIHCTAFPGDQPGTWHHHVFWIINAKKLDTSDSKAYSSSFTIPISDKDPEASFKLAFYAKEKFLAKRGRQFKKARGTCDIRLVANHVFQGEVTRLNLRFMVGSCDAQKIQIRPEHGHVTNDFREHNVATLPKDMQDWNLKDYVDEATQKFIVSVEVRGLPLPGSQSADR